MVYVGMRSRFDARGGARAYRLWRSRPDVVFSSSVDAQVIGQLIAARSGARHLTAEHGGAGIPRSFHRRLLTRLVAPRVAGAIAVSASQIPELSELGYPPERITVIPNGIPYPTPNREAAAVRGSSASAQRMSLPSSSRRSVPRSAQGASSRRRSRPSARAATACCRRRRRPRSRARPRARCDGPRVVRVLVSGATSRTLSRPVILSALRAASRVCLWSCSSRSRSRGPVLATAVGGLPEVVIPGRTGWLVPFGDAELTRTRSCASRATPASDSSWARRRGCSARNGSRSSEWSNATFRCSVRFPAAPTPERPAQTAGHV